MIRYGVVLGYAIHDIKRGDWINEHMLELPESPSLENMEYGTNLVKMEDLPVPVSYTHLDVYKRQDHYYDLCWRGTWEKEGGGCTFIHAVHHIDLFLWMMGEVESLQAMVDLSLIHI